MKNKLIKIIAAFLIALSTITPVNMPVFADGCEADICSDSCDAPQAVKDAAGCSKEDDKDISSVITNIINAIIGVIGIVAVIFIIMGGVQYMTASGDASKTKKAKDTILYACIGLAVCALAFAIANFAISTINNSH